jgi:CBS domain-containing protein
MPAYYFPGSVDKEAAMQVSEILRVKGNALYTIPMDGTAIDAVKSMADHNMGSLVVFDKGRMVGLLTFHEVLGAMSDRDGTLDGVRVGDIMQREPVIATPKMDVNDLRRVMIESGARYLPVMDGSDLLGVISFRDVAKAVLEEQDFENRMLKGYIKNWPD